jgi:hypothetical protein
MGKRRALATAITLLGVALPSQVEGQSLLDLLASIRQGGGWIDVPIQDGKGGVLTPVLPTAGMNVAGCFRVWGGHSGSWAFDVRDTQNQARLQRQTVPDQPVPFTHATGALAQLDLQVRWSEPRDTTLVLWVGLRTPTSARDPCEPIYGAAPPPPTTRPPYSRAAAAFRSR